MMNIHLASSNGGAAAAAGGGGATTYFNRSKTTRLLLVILVTIVTTLLLMPKISTYEEYTFFNTTTKQQHGQDEEIRRHEDEIIITMTSTNARNYFIADNNTVTSLSNNQHNTLEVTTAYGGTISSAPGAAGINETLHQHRDEIVPPPAVVVEEDDNILVALSSDNFTLASDIIKITHLPNKREIHVHLKTPAAQRRCKRPKLRGRLSGPYLALLTWDNDSVYSTGTTDNDSSTDVVITSASIGLNYTENDTSSETAALRNPSRREDGEEKEEDHENNILVGHYQVPSGGTYYIEIIALLCERINYHTNFVRTCLEEPARHRITANNATVEIFEPLDEMRNQMDYPLGFWKWRDASKEYKPLLTRYQPVGCWHPKSKESMISLGCADMSDTTRFDDYTFVWNDKSVNDSQWYYVGNNYKGKEKVHGGGWVVRGDIEQYKGDFNATVCFNGMSHSDRMMKQMDILNITQSIKVVLERTLISAPLQGIDFAGQFKAMKAKFNCTRSLIAIGQWAASFSGSVPFLIHEWEDRMKRMVVDLRNAGVEPMFRSLHMQPIGERQGTCPPMDWRAHALDEYNQVLKKISREMDVIYFDTEFIMSPLWDSWSDWMHPENEPLWKECNFLMREMMKLRWK